MRKKVVGVIGGRSCNIKVERLAHNLGKNLGKVADILVTGGLGGVMASVSEGFKAAGGTTLGILPTYNKADANPHIDIAIPSGLGLARNVLVVKSADCVVALPGSAGTLSEIAYCLQFQIPVISLGSWKIPGVIKTTTVKETIARVKTVLHRRK